MLCAQLREDGIEVADEVDVDFFLVFRSDRGPARLGPVAVVVPFEKRNVVLIEKLIEEAVDVGAHVGAGKIEHQLIAPFGARTAGEVQYPIGMLAVKIAVGVDHLRLNPQAEIHAERVNFVDERLKTVGKLLRIDVPIAEAGVIVLALAKPAIVHNEAFYAEAGSLFCERHLAGFIDAKLGRLPGVIEDGAELWSWRVREQRVYFEAVHEARCAADAVAGVSTIEVWGLEVLAFLQAVAEVKSVESAGNAHLLQLILLDGNLPRTAPPTRAEPCVAAV